MLGNKNATGYKHTDEAKAIMRQSMLGKKHTEETKNKISIANIGKHRESPSEESKRKMRIANINYRSKLGYSGGRSVGKNENELLDGQEIVDACKILRQYNIKHLGYIVDGYCVETNTVYEVYEKYHFKQIEHDLKRQNLIESQMNCLFKIIWDKKY
jgi:hypothetical protein